MVVVAVVALAATGLLVFVPNAIVTRWTALVRAARVGVAVAWFFVALFGIMTALRWLQRQRVL